jgi:membrane protein YdbS with pleckstrin-like domain
VARRTLVSLALAWLSAAAIIVALTLWLLPEFEMRWVAAGGAILLLLPLVRLGLAPLMLAWNRHR